MKKFIHSVILLSVIGSFSCKGNQEHTDVKEIVVSEKNKKPNIVYILADDMGYADAGVYGQAKIKTPNIDKLASKGMLFTQHYAGSTVCAPSRAVLMTGIQTPKNPIRGNKPNPGEGQAPMPANTFTVAHMLKNAGYVTGAFGKWGLGFPGSVSAPNKMGFDEFYGYNCQRYAHRYYPPFLRKNGEKVILNNVPEKNTYAPTLIFEEAINFIKKNKDTTFFAFLPIVEPHAELASPKDSIWQYYADLNWEETPRITPKFDYDAEPFIIPGYQSQPKPRTTYATMVSRVDAYVGEVVAELENQGVLDNTIVIFTSDNGPHVEGGNDPEFFDSNGVLRGHKRDLYEGGIRVPLIVSWNGKVQPNTKTDAVTGFVDIMATLADILDVEAPENEGVSFYPTLLGDIQSDLNERILSWEFYEANGRRALRMGKWKAVQYHVNKDENGAIELYDLSVDVGESNNLATQYPEIIKQVSTYFKEQHIYNPDFKFKWENNN
ncbi:arylsulfatase [Joostella sp. CR20]